MTRNGLTSSSDNAFNTRFSPSLPGDFKERFPSMRELDVPSACSSRRDRLPGSPFDRATTEIAHFETRRVCKLEESMLKLPL